MKTASADRYEGNLKTSLILILLVVLSRLASRDAVAENPKHLPMMPSFDRSPSKNAPVGPAGNQERTMHLNGTGKMKHEKVDPNRDKLTTIPHWTGEFSYHGITYPYTMVGTDPSKGSATTVVPTVIIPLRFVFSDGSVVDTSTDLVDGQTAIQGIINSPIFQRYPFFCGGINVGNTQWGDAGQRANFWNYVSTRSPDYHVLLGQPTVLPVQTINVPADQGGYILQTFFQFSQIDPFVKLDFLEQQRHAITSQLEINPRSLAIFVTGPVLPDFGSSGGNYHGADRVSSGKDPLAGAQTFIVAGYMSQSDFGGFIPDVIQLSHELSEWVSDPFGGNLTGGWDLPLSSSLQCDSDGLEVCDPLDPFLISGSGHGLPLRSFTYHVEDRVFLDYFTRTGRSNAANGLFSFFGLITAPTSVCTGRLNLTYSDPISFPGSPVTIAVGINNRQQIVGLYVDAAGKNHGFMNDGKKFTTIDFPGAALTQVYKINDAGLMVGFYENTDGLDHGFSYQNGRYTSIDFPGSVTTDANGVNSSGDIVGQYSDNSGVTHGFILSHGKYQRTDAPYSSDTALTFVNDLGRTTGFTFDDPNGPFTGFVKDGKNFAPFQFPGARDTEPYSINNSNMLGGIFFNADGYSNGFATVFGYPYQIYGYVYGNNDLGQIAGAASLPSGQVVGFTAQLPTKPAGH
jgi:hypothetical protein